MNTSAENPDAGQGSVLLDIGGDVGALIVTMPAELEGVEVEIRPFGAPDLPAHGHGHGHGHVHGQGHYPHVEVVLRPTAEGPVPSLVFPGLVEGRYELYVKETHDVELLVDVTGGEVSIAHWPR
jgi:hypothetical protein